MHLLGPPEKPSDKLTVIVTSMVHYNGTLQYTIDNVTQVISVQHHIVIYEYIIVLSEGGKGGLPGTFHSLCTW